MQIFIHDQWINDSKAVISVKDIAVLRGFGIFDYLRSYGNYLFRLEDHIDRFFNSASHLGMTPKYSKERLSEILTEGIRRNGFKNTNVKFIQTGGISMDGFLPAQDQTFFAYFYEGGDLPASYYENGIKVMTSSLMRQLPEAKTINYAAGIVEVMKARTNGSDDIIHTDPNGDMYECTRSNFFGVKNGKLITAETGILKGITRKVILEIAKRENIPVDLRCINISEIRDLDEAFITNSSQEVLPVIEIDSILIGSGKPGLLTKELLKSFRGVVMKRI